MHALTQYIYWCELIIKKLKDKLIDAKVETLDTNLGLQSLVPIRGSVNLDVMCTEFKWILLMGNGAYIRLKSGKKCYLEKPHYLDQKLKWTFLRNIRMWPRWVKVEILKMLIFSLWNRANTQWHTKVCKFIVFLRFNELSELYGGGSVSNKW